MATFFTGDTHFGDPRVLRIDKRPFKTIPEHDAALVARWNETVASGCRWMSSAVERRSESKVSRVQCLKFPDLLECLVR